MHGDSQLSTRPKLFENHENERGELDFETIFSFQFDAAFKFVGFKPNPIFENISNFTPLKIIKFLKRLSQIDVVFYNMYINRF